MSHLRKIPKPTFGANSSSSERMTAWIVWSSQRDALGHKVQLALGIIALVMIPLSSTLATIGSTLFIGYALLRCHVLYPIWKELLFNPCVLALLALYAWLALSVTWSLDPDHGVRLLRGSRYLLMIPALAPLLLDVKRVLLGPCIALLIVLPIQAYGLIIGDPGFAQGALSEHPGFMGIWMCVTCASLSLGMRSNPLGSWGHRLAPVGMITIALSAARSVLLASGTSLFTGLTVMFWHKDFGRFRSTLAVIATLAIAAGIVFGFRSEMSRRISGYNQMENTAASTVDDFPIDGARPLWWRIGIEGFLAKPMTGFGVGSAEELITGDDEVVRITDSGRKNSYVNRDDFHSSYITAAAESGGIGSLLFLAWVGCLARSCMRKKTISPVLTACLTALLVFGVFNTMFFSGRLVALIAFVTTLAIKHDGEVESAND